MDKKPNFLVFDRIISSKSKSQPNDIIIEYPRIGVYGVINAYPETHCPEHPANIFIGGETGDKIILNLISDQLQKESADHFLKDIVLKINDRIRSYMKDAGFPNGPANLLPGASFALIKFTIGKGYIEIIQGGDCLIAWAEGETLKAFSNQACNHVADNYRTIELLMSDCRNDKQKMWDKFFPILSERRKLDINSVSSPNGYASLNGQSKVSFLWRETTLIASRVNLLFLTTDGMFPIPNYVASINEETVAGLINEYSYSESLPFMVEARRVIERKNLAFGKKNYTDYKNIVAIVLKKE